MTKPTLTFTQETQFAFNRAVELSAAYNHAVIKPEHLLLGLLQTPGCAAVAILGSLNADLKQLAHKIENTFGPLRAPGTAAHYVVFDQGTHISAEVDTLLSGAATEAHRTGLKAVDTRLVLLNLLRQTGSLAAQLLHEQNVTLLTAHAVTDWPDENLSPAALPPPTWRELPLRVSPVFIGLSVATLAASALTYLGGDWVRVTLFLFVTGGWIISLSLHEFGHAIVAFFGGDRSVVEKGYLTLNPFKYTHKLLSIVLPVVFTVLGGIGLPGGAVYINRSAIRSKGMLSLMSAAGPLATAACAFGLSLPFVFRLASRTHHVEFWAGLALLMLLQLSALFFNLLPLPGLDGFGILEPFLPAGLLNLAYRIRGFTFFIIFFLFINDTPVSTFFWSTLDIVIRLVGVHPHLIATGLDLYRFWSR